MTAVQWIRLLEKQYRDYNKSVYTVTELMAISGLKRNYLLNQLCSLVKRKVLIRYKYGLYGVIDCSPEQLLPYMDSSAYCTGHYALFKHGYVTQIPSTVTCFTKRHYGQNRIKSAGGKRYEFFKPRTFNQTCQEIASPEQALCDYVYFCRNRGLSFSSLVTFRKLSNLNREKIKGILINYPKTVQDELKLFLKIENQPYLN
jgi:hypothetical protein